jgi:hypothetical protein
MNFWLTLPEIRWQSCLSPGKFNLDVSLSRIFKLHEKMTL